MKPRTLSALQHICSTRLFGDRLQGKREAKVLNKVTRGHLQGVLQVSLRK